MTLIPPRFAYLKPNKASASFWIGVSDHIGRPFAFEGVLAAEDNFYSYGIRPVLSQYLPLIGNLRPYNKWAGHYDMNTFDADQHLLVLQRI